jgi:NhaA family Na+:H+ antiporter
VALLSVATAAALLWANSPWQAGYRDLAHDLHFVVNDGLMAVFFFAVGLEIKRELTVGELSAWRHAALPVVAAAGGMVVPALVYVAVNIGGDGVGGWGIPMATDIAFAVGVLALAGDRLPSAVRVLVLALAVVDDLGVIVVIAVFYADDLAVVPLLVGLAGLAAIAVLRRAGRHQPVLHVALGVGVWFAVHESGVHATIAGVAVALLVPVASGERLERALVPWTERLILPLFALVNAGVVLSADAVGDAAGSAVTLGIVLGLVVGKPLGVGGAAWLAVRAGWVHLPPGVATRHLAVLASVAGIGFTVSLFVAGLAFDDPALTAEATIGVLVGSLLATAVAVGALRTARS